MKRGFLYMLIFPNGKRYIGITTCSLYRRMVLHRHHARKGRKGALQAAIRKYGNFEIIHLVTARWSYLIELERRAIAAFETRHPRGYNLTDGGEGNPGWTMTTEQKNAVRKRNLDRIAEGYKLELPRGYKHSDETRAKMSLSRMGHPMSDETRKKIGRSKLGNKYGLGQKRSEESRAKMSAWQKGKPKSEVHKAALRAAKQRWRESNAINFIA